jgi:hypothetical protein
MTWFFLPQKAISAARLANSRRDVDRPGATVWYGKKQASRLWSIPG